MPLALPTPALLMSALLALFLAAAPGRAEQPVYYSEGGAAIGGYDTVAYFVAGDAVRGRADIAVMWKGAVWHFVSPENRETFEANPRAYAPQYGGYCAYGVAQGYTVDTDPTAWRIVDGRLYLIHSPGVLKMWMDDMPGHIALSEANWPAVLFTE